MKIKKFSVGEFDANTVVLQDHESGKQVLLSEEEFAILRFLIENEKEELLGILLPNIGVAKRHHIDGCLRTIRKLRSLNMIDYESLFGSNFDPDGKTIEMEIPKVKFHLESVGSLAATIIGLFERLLSIGGSFSLILFLLGFSAFGFLFFPIGELHSIAENEISYSALIVGGFFTISLALSFRTLVQSAFLRANKRGVRDPSFKMVGIFPTLSADRSEINLLGVRGKITFDLLGIVSPLALAGIFMAAFALKAISFSTAYDIFAVCVGVSMWMICPFTNFDGSEIIALLSGRRVLQNTLSNDIRQIFHRAEGLDNAIKVGLFFSIIWYTIWLVLLKDYASTFSAALSRDLHNSENIATCAGAIAGIFLILNLGLVPLLDFFLGFISGMRLSNARAALLQAEKELSFEEQIAALEKIPLFAILNDKDRLSMFNQMQLAFFKDGAMLMSQGEIGKDFFVLVRGHATAYHRNLKGEERALADLSEGDAFGEIALIDEVPRTASIISSGGCFALILKKAAFAQFAESVGSPDRVKQMIRLSSFFRRHPLFNKLEAGDQAALIDAFRFQSITPGQEIPLSNENNEECFYVVYSGKVHMGTADDSADTTLDVDDCFGYANLFRGKYSAIEGGGLLSIKVTEFHTLIWNKLVAHPELFLNA